MIAYICPLFFAIFACLSRSPRFLIQLACICAALIIGFKGAVDKDYYAYEYLLNLAYDHGIGHFSEYLELIKMEIGFVGLNLLMSANDFNVMAVFLFHSIASCFVIFKICRKLGANQGLTFLLLYSFSFIGLWVQIRFGFASLVGLLAILFFSERRYIPAAVALLFAAAFHSVVLGIALIIPVYYLLWSKGLNVSAKVFIILGASLAVACIDISPILNLLMGSFNSRYQEYAGESAGSRISFFIRLPFFLALTMLINRMWISDRRLRILFTMATTSIVIWSFAWSVSILYRIGVFLELGYCVFLIRNLYPTKGRYLTAAVILSALCTWRIFSSLGELSTYELNEWIMEWL